GPEGHAVVAARVIRREVDVAAVRGIALDERHLIGGGARVHERTADHRRERSVGEPRTADIADRLRILRVEDRRKPGGEALDKYFEHHVGLGDPVMRTGKRNVVDLDEERSLIDRTELEGFAIERPAVPAWGIRREGGLDGGDGRGGLRLRRST